jgi:hypothetical protein
VLYRNYVLDICIHNSYLTKLVKIIIYFYIEFVNKNLTCMGNNY